jgi:hypothetical protein
VINQKSGKNRNRHPEKMKFCSFFPPHIQQPGCVVAGVSSVLLSLSRRKAVCSLTTELKRPIDPLLPCCCCCFLVCQASNEGEPLHRVLVVLHTRTPHSSSSCTALSIQIPLASERIFVDTCLFLVPFEIHLSAT